MSVPGESISNSHLASQSSIWLLARDGANRALERSLVSLAQHTHGHYQLTLVTPGQAELAVEELASRFGAQFERISVWGSVLTWHDIANTCDDETTFVIRAGVEVPPEWDMRLISVMEEENKAVTISPLSPAIPLFSPWDGDNLTSHELDYLCQALGDRFRFELPYCFPGCFLLRLNCLDKTDWPSTDVMTDAASFVLSEHLYQRGHLHLATSEACVAGCHLPDTQRAASASQLELTGYIQHASPLATLRHRISERIASDQSQPSLLPITRRSVRLHIMHNWGGGLERWVHDFCTADAQHVNLILKPIGTWGAFGQRLELYSHIDAPDPIQVWELALPIRATAVAHHAYREALDEIVSEYRVEAILVSSLIGHSLDALMMPVKTIVICHEYYPFCPALYIFNRKPCKQCDQADLSRCFTDNPANRFFKNLSAREWQLLRQAYIEQLQRKEIEVVIPSPSVAANLRRLAPILDDKFIHVIPHGMDHPKTIIPLKHHIRPRVLILGGLFPEKGLEIFRAILPQLLNQADVYLLGCGQSGEEFIGRDGITMIPRYGRSELSQHLDIIAADIGLLLSIVPETFSYTLSELWLAGIPVVATNVGSFQDRIEHRRTGLLTTPEPSAVMVAVAELLDDPVLRQTIKTNIEALPERSCRDMIDDYVQLIDAPIHSKARRPIPTVLSRQQLVLDRTWDTRKPFSDIIIEAKHYVEAKVCASPRLRQWQKKIILGISRGCFSLAFRVNSRVRHVR